MGYWQLSQLVNTHKAVLLGSQAEAGGMGAGEVVYSPRLAACSKGLIPEVTDNDKSILIKLAIERMPLLPWSHPADSPLLRPSPGPP